MQCYVADRALDKLPEHSLGQLSWVLLPGQGLRLDPCHPPTVDSVNAMTNAVYDYVM